MATTSEILIIGAGVIGLSLARELKKRGAGTVTIVDQGTVGRESSWAAAGMLSAQAETERGSEILDICLESRRLYPGFVRELADETGVDVEFDRSGTLYLAFDESGSAKLRKRVEWQVGAGLKAENMTANEATRAEPFISPDVHAAAFFAEDWQVDSRKLLQALRAFAEFNDINIIENTAVTELISDRGHIRGVKTANGEIRAETTVVTTGAWTSLIKLGTRQLPVSVRPVRGQIVCFRTAKRLFRRVIYCSSGYLVPRADGRVLVGATSEDAGFDKRVTADGVRSLLAAATDMAPALIGQEIVDKWSGLRPATPDGLPVLGTFSGLDGLFMATGHYRNGILLAPVTAAVMADRIVNGTRSTYLEQFGPDRFGSSGARSAFS